MTPEILKEKIKNDLKAKYNTDAENAKAFQLHEALSAAVMEDISDRWQSSIDKHLSQRRACYLSMEFLVGRAIYNNLLALGLTETAEKAFEELGRSLGELEQIEDAALGNGGLGRLAACFLDSAATHDIPLDGYGIRYKYGLFKQLIVDGFQKETADDWSRFGDPWSVRRSEESVLVKYSDMTVKAVPYDMPIIGYDTQNIGTLRLWQAEAETEFDFEKFNRGDFAEASSDKNRAEDISRVLYPNDNFYEGKMLRLRQ